MLPETRLEDLAFMAAMGETSERAAERLGIRLDALEKWTRTHGADAQAVWAHLRRNDYRASLGHGARAGKLTVTR